MLRSQTCRAGFLATPPTLGPLAARTSVLGRRVTPISITNSQSLRDVKLNLVARKATADDNIQQPNIDSTKLAISPALLEPSFILTALLGFAAVSYNVEFQHAFDQVDAMGHQLALTFDPQLRKDVVDKAISEFFIDAGVVGWVVCTILVLLEAKTKDFQILAWSWLLYVFGSGPIRGPGFGLISILKESFHRVRPSTIHSTYSYPSGHTASATFVVGSLLFVMIPLAMTKAKLNENTRAFLLTLQGSWVLWTFVIGETAAARVVADAHWFSDTVGGMFIGAACVSLLALGAKALEANDEERQRKSDNVDA